MKTISELISQEITPTDKNRKKQGEVPPPWKATRRTAESEYEATVFNFLLDKKGELGIESVTKFKNRLVDGQVILSNRKLLVVEVKFRMNWERACQAEWQFRQYLKRIATDPSRVDGAIVIFQEFSGDWKKATASRKNAWGWEAWYLYHHDVEGKPMHLLMFSDGEFQGYPDHRSA